MPRTPPPAFCRPPAGWRATGKRLQGPLGGLWRYRVGDMRVICQIEDQVLRVLVLRLGKRSEIYR